MSQDVLQPQATVLTSGQINNSASFKGSNAASMQVLVPAAAAVRHTKSISHAELDQQRLYP